MTWLFSEAMMRHCENLRSSQDQGEEYLAGTCSDGKQFAQLNVIPTQHPFWRNDKTTDTSGPSLFGLTCAVLTANRGAELLTLYRADSLARISALREKAQGLPASAADSGNSLRGSLARYDRDSHTLKTAQHSLLEDSTLCCVTLPRSGSMRNGAVYQREKLAHRMSVIGCGYSQKESIHTTTVCGNHNRKGASKTSGDGLATYVRKYPTPTAHNAKETNAPSESMRNTPTLGSIAGGPMNPTFPEWLMGWPIGWTDLKQLETARFREWQRQHSPS